MAALIPFQNPFFRGDWWDISPTKNFGMGLLEEPLAVRPWGIAPYWVEKDLSEVRNDKDEFSINLDVSHFKPEEIKVTAKENTVEVAAKHEEKRDPHGFISRSFTRRYVLPKEVDVTKLSSQLNNDGVLSIQAPKIVEDASKERTVPIELRNRPASIKRRRNDETTSTLKGNGKPKKKRGKK